jgi:hypothetical protein
MIVHNAVSIVEVVGAIIIDDSLQLFTEQSNLYCTQNTQQWKVMKK